jgi:hypothetical protein
MKYKYTKIGRSDKNQFGLAPNFWANHPEWTVFVRTNLRVPGNDRVWVSGGGATLQEAIESAEYAIRHYKLSPSIRVQGGVILVGTNTEEALEGEESPTPIMNETK